MEDTIKEPRIGDVLWSADGKYGKIIVGVAGDSKVYDYTLFNDFTMWAGYSPASIMTNTKGFVYLFNLQDLIKDCINEPSN